MKERKKEKIGKIIRIVLVILCFGALGYAIYWAETTKEYIEAGGALYHRYGKTLSFAGYMGDSLEVNIPEKVRGMEVTCIFRITESGASPSGYRIYIPDTVTDIYYDAFRGCKDLTITGGKNIESIEGNAFKDCSFAEPFPFSNELKYIGEGAFEQVQGLGEIHLGSNLEYIGDHAFFGADVTLIVEKGSGIESRVKEEAEEYDYQYRVVDQIEYPE